jgi:CelD/BcsL family acetyltransferase involved in cellulose biosynthesis
VALQTIESERELEALYAEWLALWQRSSSATPFQSPDWLIPWWQFFGTGQLCVVVMRDGANVIAIAPFFSRDESPRTLRFLGTGNTDYLDVLVDDRAPEDYAATILEYLCRDNSWDRIELENLPHG